MEYNLKPIHTVLDNVDDLDKAFSTDLKDRIIEKRGAVQEFTMNDIEYNMKELLNKKKELEAKREYENAKKENIEHFHPFVKDITPQDLLTTWMYKECSGWVSLCDEKIKQINEQIEEDNKEIEEIKKQIAELAE